ncbi:hypothetical protein [Streptomyces sp. 029-5]
MFVGDASDALVRVSDAVAESDRPWPTPLTITEADTSGPHFTAEAIPRRHRPRHPRRQHRLLA